MRKKWVYGYNLCCFCATTSSLWLAVATSDGAAHAQSQSRLPCTKASAAAKCLAPRLHVPASAAGPAVGAPETGEEAITVTTKVKTRDQPEAATNFSERTIAARNITRPADFIAQTPNMTAVEANNPGDLRITIRGDAQAQNTDPPVAVVIDGVELTGATGLNNDLLDLQGISVVKGPQSFLYGRDAIAGAINITTTAPTDEFHGTATAGGGNGGTAKTGYMLSGPIIPDVLLFSAALSYRNTDGFYKDTTTNQNVDPYQSILGHLKLDWFATPDLTVHFAGMASHVRAGATAYTSQSVTPSLQTGGLRSSLVDANFAEPVFVSPVEDYSKALDELFSVTVDYTKPWGAFRSVSAYEYENDIFASANYPYPAGSTGTQYNQRGNVSWSQDLRFTSPETKRLQYIVGVDGALIRQNPFLLAATSLFSQGTVLTAEQPITNPLNPTASFSRDELYAKAAGIYGNLSYRPLQKLVVTLAARYDYEGKSDTDAAPPAFSATSGQERYASYYSFQPKVNLAYHFTNDIMAYAVYAQGFKAGGFNPAQTNAATGGLAPNEYPSEKAYDLEGGFKSLLFHEQVTLDLTGFYTIKDNAQVFEFIPAGALNAVTVLDRTDTEGFELQGGWRLTHELTFQSGLGYTHSTIGSDHADPTFVGNRAPYIPDVSANANLTYTRPIGHGVDMVGDIGYQHWGSQYFSAANTPWTKRNALDFLDARIAFQHERTGLEVDLWAKNLTDVRYLADVIAIFNDASDKTQAVFLAPPRTFGGDLTYRF